MDLPCRGFPEISQGQEVGWIWLRQMKALHKQWGGPSSPTRAGRHHEFQAILGAFIRVGDVTAIVATTAATCKTKGQCYHRWTAHRM